MTDHCHKESGFSAMLKHQPKTLARTLAYIGLYSPGEFGLYWDSDGSMPWKEFYWALQQDDSLRFVRESNLRELALLGVDLPFTLDGNRLRLCSSTAGPVYPSIDKIPERLYYAVKSNKLVYIQKFGLRAISRAYIPVCAEREMALRITKRRESDPVLIEILAKKALDAGVCFFDAGAKLFLVDAVAPEFLILPKIREEQAAGSAEKKPKPAPKAVPGSPGSFVVQVQHVQGVAGQKPNIDKGKKRKGGWKTDARKERNKRNI